MTAGEDVEAARIESDGYSVSKERWPGGAAYAACLTHDVDNVERPRSHLRERRDRFGALDYLAAVMGLRSLYNNIGLVASMERARGLTSSFYLMAFNYDLGPLAPTLASLRSEGWDIGLHGDFGTHDSEERMAEAASRVARATGGRPAGVREHYLRFDFAKSWGVMQSTGFSYDTTVGNSQSLGFRTGICTPFHPPDSAWRPMALLELPLVLMDATIWGALKRREAEGMADFLAMKKKVAGVGGLFTLLWHQESVRMKGGRLYPKLLDEVLADRCYVGNGAQVAAWWEARNAPIAASEDSFSMDAAPKGLAIRFKAKDERRLTVRGGTSEASDGSISVVAAGGPLAVEVG